MKTAFIGILNDPSTSMNSHSAGWTRIVRELIDPTANCLHWNEDWNGYDRLIINHGPNFKPGSFNVIGGIGEGVHRRMDRLSRAIENGAALYQTDGFQMADFIAKRKLHNLYSWEGSIPEISIEDRPLMVRGDSHSLSVWPGPTHGIRRMDGKTLWGFLKNPEKADIYYFGNIDVRFHLTQFDDPIAHATELAKRYCELAAKYEAAVTWLLPAERETRKIPKSGMYHGKPFYGSRQVRMELVQCINEFLEKNNDRCIKWPLAWYHDYAHYEQVIMEPRQSVHIRPRHYKYHFDPLPGEIDGAGVVNGTRRFFRGVEHEAEFRE